MLTLVLLLLSGLSLISADEVVVMDTMKQSALDWVVWPDDGSPWQELSWNNPETGNDHRGYHVCSVGEVEVNNWFRTPYIRFEEDVATVYVNISFLMRECTDYPERYYQCRTTFSVLKYESDLDFASASTPAWNEDDYDVVKTVPADHTYTDPERDPVIPNNVTFSFEKSLKGFYLAVRDSGMCSFILSMQIWYRRCPAKIIRHTVLRSTPAGANIVTVYGQCVENAVVADQSQTLEFLCTNLGEWFNPTNSKGCVCKPGFEPNGDQCDRCPIGKFKSKAENEECQPCPGNSSSTSTGLRACICHNGFYRAPNEGAEVKCTKPPSEIRELVKEKVSDDSVRLRWKSPIQNGGRSDVHYRVECDLCSAAVSTVFNETSVTIANLVPNTRYVVTVYALNGVSSVAPSASGQTVEFITLEGSAPKNKIMKIQATHNTLELNWPAVNQAASYQVEWYPREEIDKKQVLRVPENSVKLDNLEPSTTYSVLVKYYDGNDILIGTTQENIYSTEKSEDLVLMISLAIGAVIVCMAIVIVIVVMFLRKTNNRNQGKSCIPKNVLALFRSKQQCDKPHSDCEGLGPYTNVPFHITNTSQETTMNMPLFGQQSVQKVKTYVDPHTYEDPRQAVKEFTKEINVSCITIEAVIGGGEFGDVCRGKLKMANKPEMCVAIKTLKPGASEKSRLDFLTEASIMGQFEDLNVIFLEGVVTKSNPIMIVTEYMENGSLDTFLRANDGKLSVIQLLNMLRGIASGMTYLSGMSYVHRDLAARNILVNESLICKVADFGLSREVEYDTSEGAYTTRGGKIPVRWTAPEAISHRKFTSASDIWSFGVVMWEVISYGERPYWDWSNQEVIKTVDKGYRLPPPMDCPEAVHQLMLDCWQKDRKNRPKFSAVQTTLERLMASPELLKKLAKPTMQSALFDNEMNEVSPQMTVSEWLQMIKMDRYTEAFEQKGIYTMEQVAWLTFADLLEMGVTLVGHQKKIMSSAQSLRPRFDGTASPVTMSEGFLV